jgi:hypothetical protein
VKPPAPPLSPTGVVARPPPPPPPVEAEVAPLPSEESFDDHELVEFVMGLPSTYKLKGFTSKYLLKKAAEPYLPNEIIQRKKKGTCISWN